MTSHPPPGAPTPPTGGPSAPAWPAPSQDGPHPQAPAGQGWSQAPAPDPSLVLQAPLQQHPLQQHPLQQHPQPAAWQLPAPQYPATQYPAPQFPPPPRPPRQGVPSWAWAIAATLVVAVVVVFALPAFVGDDPGGDPTGDPTATTPPDDGFGQPNSSPSGTFTGEHMVTTMNEALAARDRPAFFRFVEDDALAPLSLWWDNMDVLQWTAGAFAVGPGQDDAYADDVIELRVSLGAVTPGSPEIPGDSDHPDAGLSYAPSNLYTATIRVTDDGRSGVITTWQPTGTAAPWDLEPLYAVVSEHSVMAGYADERDLVDELAPLGELGATWVVDTYERETGVANAQRFATFVTIEAERFNDWFIEDTSGWVADRAGTMFPQRRPWPAAGIDAGIATGGPSLNAGGILTIGPNGILYGADDTQDTIVHEFVHAIHTTNTPNEGWPGSTAVEGWAVYNESLFRGDGEFGARNTYIGTTVRRCLDADAWDGTFPTQQDFVDVDTVQCAYSLSGSMYAYAASLGADVYEAADVSLEQGVPLPEAVASIGGPVVDEAGWAAWLEESFGGS